MSVFSVAAGNRLVQTPLLAGPTGFQNPLFFTENDAATGLGSVAHTQSRSDRCAIVCAAKTGRDKAAKKKSGKPDKGVRDFDPLILVWDDAFEKCCETPSRAKLLKAIAKEGLERHGRGCVLVTESIRTVPRGYGSGCTNMVRPESDDTTASTSFEWIAEYVPRKLIEDPTAFNEQASQTSGQLQPGVEEFPLVKQSNWLEAVKRMMDRTRLLSLTCPVEKIEPGKLFAEDAGGEAPYNPEAQEFVLVLSHITDGGPTLGADVVRGNEDDANGRCKLTDTGCVSLDTGYKSLPEELDPKLLPGHVAIIMDGNSRWAENRGWPASIGHEMGVRSLREVIELSCRWGIQALTVFAFSAQNWHRPEMEITFLMNLFERVLQHELKNLMKEDVCISIMGDLSTLPPSLQSLVARACDSTRSNKGLKLTVALSYSGRQDIVEACKRLASKVADGSLHTSDITELALDHEMGTSWMGKLKDPDLLIRTSGEKRLSNFMLWQMAYTELYFTNSLWPDFGGAEYLAAIQSYQQRDRRFGGRSKSPS